jgi:hypothetical protein
MKFWKPGFMNRSFVILKVVVFWKISLTPSCQASLEHTRGFASVPALPLQGKGAQHTGHQFARWDSNLPLQGGSFSEANIG